MLSLDEILKLRKEIILKGKRCSGFLKRAKGRIGPKYNDPNDISHSGSISSRDCEILYELVKKNNPKRILEIGTWFGVSAMVLDKSSSDETMVYTCDKHDFCQYESPTVKRFTGRSTLFYKVMKKKGLEFDFVFMDGRFLDDDQNLLLKILCKNAVYVTHDYEPGGKGKRNIEKLKGYIHDIKKTDSCIAYGGICGKA